MLTAFAWFPWSLLFATKALNDRKVKWVVFLSLSLSSQLINHVSIFIITIFLIGCLAIYSTKRKRIIPFLKLFFLGSSLLIVLIIGLCSYFLLPLLENLPYISRIFERSAFTSLPPVLLISSIIPTNFQYPEWIIYFGNGLIVLALLNGKKLYRDPNQKLWLILGCFGIIASLGEYTPLYKLLFGWNIGISLLRIPPRWWLLVLTSISILAAYGLENSDWPQTARKKRFLFPVLTIILVDLILYIISRSTANFPFQPLLPLIICLLILILLIIDLNRTLRAFILAFLCGAEVLVYSFSLIRPQAADFFLPNDPIQKFLSLGVEGRVYTPYFDISPSFVSKYHLSSVEGYDPPYLFTHYTNFIQQATKCLLPGVAVPNGKSPESVNQYCMGSSTRWDWLALLNMYYIILPTENARPPQFVPIRSNNNATLYSVPGSVGRGFGVSEVVLSGKQCLETLASIDTNLVAVVEKPVLLKSTKGKISIQSRTGQSGEEEFLTKSENDFLLIRSEVWAPGWRAVVDGSPGELLRGDCTLQAVIVPAGKHEIEFVYRPTIYLVGKWISIASILLIIFIMIIKIIFGRKLKSTKSSSAEHSNSLISR